MARQRIQQPTIVLSSSRIDGRIRKLPIIVSSMGMRQLKLSSVEFHHPIIEQLIEEGKLLRSDLKAGRSFNHRLMVNYVRYNRVNVVAVERKYREILARAIEIAGFHDGYRCINNRLLDAIKEQYPLLAEECEAQRYDDPLIEPEDIFRTFSTKGDW
jgi:hypothetical protein